MVRQRSGLTRFEVVLLLIIAVTIAGLLLPAVQKTHHGPSSRNVDINNLKQIVLAVHSYSDVHKKFPPATATSVESQKRALPLSIHLLPFLEQNPLFLEYLAGKEVPLDRIRVFDSYLDPSASTSIRVQNYAGNVRVFSDIGVKTLFDREVVGLDAKHGNCSTTFKDTFTDGTSNTLAFATRYANHGEAAKGAVANCSSYDALVGADNSAFFGVVPMSGPVSPTSSGGWQLAPPLSEVNCRFGAVAHSFREYGIPVALADGSVYMLSPRISAFTWNAAMQPNDGNKLASDWLE